jgi:hypothetical protein
MLPVLQFLRYLLTKHETVCNLKDKIETTINNLIGLLTPA